MTDEMTPAEKLGKLLRDRRELYGWKVEALARRADLDASYLSRIERGLRGKRRGLPPEETLKKICYAYQIPFDQLYMAVTGSPLPSPAAVTFEHILEEYRMRAPVAIPIVDHPAHAGHAGTPIRDYVYADRPFAVNRNLLCLPVKGDCMAPRIEEGDFVIVDRDASPSYGEVVVAVISEEVVIRYFGHNDTEYVLRAESPEVPAIHAKETDIVGVVVEVRKRPRRKRP